MPEFWSKVRKSATCWSWVGARNWDGYGRVDKSIKAHRFSWELHNGPIPNGMHVLHSCHNPSCVNPAHLRLGTHQDNMRDREASGRGIKGERVGIARFNEISIRRIRIAGQAISKYKIAAALNCAHATIDCILKRATWKHVSDNVRLV